MKPALITITHNQTKNNLDLLKKYGPQLMGLYDQCYVTISDQTMSCWAEEFSRLGFRIRIIPKQGAGHARREVVKFGLEGKHGYFHYCDFDRILTWIMDERSELEELIGNLSGFDYLILGRTEKAFGSHPSAWYETEKITNRIFSLEFGQDCDICAGSAAFSRRAAQVIATYSRAQMTDAEWPMLIHRKMPFDVVYHQVNGLAYREELNGITGSRSEAERWLGRVKLSYIIGQTAINAGNEEKTTTKGRDAL